jgi:hypothetical protein
MKKTKPRVGAAAATGAAAGVVAGPATDAVIVGTTVAGVSYRGESCRESKFHPIDVSCRLQRIIFLSTYSLILRHQLNYFIGHYSSWISLQSQLV